METMKSNIEVGVFVLKGNRLVSSKTAADPSKKSRSALGSDLWTSEEGWHGLPVGFVKSGLLHVCRLYGIPRKKVKTAITIEQDGVDRDNGIPLVRLTEGSPVLGTLFGKPRWVVENWKATLKVHYCVDLLHLQDIERLVRMVGLDPDPTCGRGMNYPGPTFIVEP